jgi:hypothetical protein
MFVDMLMPNFSVRVKKAHNAAADKFASLHTGWYAPYEIVPTHRQIMHCTVNNVAWKVNYINPYIYTKVKEHVSMVNGT